MCDCCSGAKGSGDHCGLGQFGLGSAGFSCVAGVDVNAIGVLGGERDSDGYQFFVFYRNGSVGDGNFIKGLKGLHHFGRERVQFLQFGQVCFVVHFLFVWLEKERG
jgi:hypothetical protein